MRIDRDRDAVGPVVRGMGPAGFKVDDAEGRTGTVRALLLTPRRADAWHEPPVLPELTVQHLAAILDPAPEFILLGTGPILALPPRALIAALDDRGIGIEAMDSRAAARAWGVLRGEGRTIAAALYPLS